MYGWGDLSVERGRLRGVIAGEGRSGPCPNAATLRRRTNERVVIETGSCHIGIYGS
jgi:hypothetical protein